jgi:small subunit ribosomal protein S17
MITMQKVQENNTDIRKGKTLSGVVVSDKMQDTIVVAVSRFVKHPKYRKFIKRVKRYHAHDPGNTKKEGDKVDIVECRPISKKKTFKVVA